MCEFKSYMGGICEDCGCSSNECECPEEKEDFIENYIPKINLLTTEDTLSLLKEVKSLNDDIYSNKEQIGNKINQLIQLYE